MLGECSRIMSWIWNKILSRSPQINVHGYVWVLSSGPESNYEPAEYMGSRSLELYMWPQNLLICTDCCYYVEVWNLEWTILRVMQKSYSESINPSRMPKLRATTDPSSIITFLMHILLWEVYITTFRFLFG